MTHSYAREDLIAAIPPLTPARLSQFEHLQIITPLRTQNGPRYRQIDVHRIGLLCELTDDFDVNEDALVIIMSLLDQLHGSRDRLSRIAQAIGREPDDVKLRVARRMHGEG